EILKTSDNNELAFKINVENGKELLKNCDNNELANAENGKEILKNSDNDEPPFLSNKTSHLVRIRNKNSNDRSKNTLKRKDGTAAISYTCFRCGKLGHHKADCPLKEQALQAMSADSNEDTDESEDEDNVVAHMAIVDTDAKADPTQETTEVCYCAD
ncbi:hypothetical protein LINGRAHAP2_LOCUS30502, partial [Linum grandiflorum]